MAEHHIEDVIADAIREALGGKEEVGVTLRSPPNYVQSISVYTQVIHEMPSDPYSFLAGLILKQVKASALFAESESVQAEAIGRDFIFEAPLQPGDLPVHTS